MGSNGSGQLGLGDTTNRNTPTAVTALGTSVQHIFFGCALTAHTQHVPSCLSRALSHVRAIRISVRCGSPSHVRDPQRRERLVLGAE